VSKLLICLAVVASSMSSVVAVLDATHGDPASVPRPGAGGAARGEARPPVVLVAG
jgi:hypothetical protein